MSAAGKIFFFHNPKAGGSFLLQILDRLYSGSRSPMIENNVADHAALGGRYEAFRGYDAYWGHYGRDVYDAVADGHAAITNFRHPVRRIISLYNYFRFNADLPEDILNRPEYGVVKDAKHLSFADFVQSGNAVTRLYVSNVHARQLTGSLYVAADPDMEEARHFIDRLAWFYMAEYPEASLAWAGRALGWPPLSNERVNVSEAGGEGHVHADRLDRQVTDHILDMNRHDLALYDHAMQRFRAEAPFLSSAG